MPVHNVKVNLPWRELENADLKVRVYEDEELLGTIKISKGAIEWSPKNHKIPYKFGWSRFDRAMRNG